VPILPPGDYEIHVTAAGFRPIVRRGAQLAIGQTLAVDLALEVGSLEAAVTVTAEQPRLNLTNGSVSGLVDHRQIRDLPLNGCSFQQLALLQPGVTRRWRPATTSWAAARRRSRSTARDRSRTFLLDGTDINNVYNKTPIGAGVLLGVDAVLEFQVLTNAYSAEFGKAAAASSTRSRDRAPTSCMARRSPWQRDSSLDAKNYFDPKDTPNPPFERNQFGGVLGGPLRRDRTFFFRRLRRADRAPRRTGLTAVPDDNAAGILPTGPVTLHPAIPRYLEVLSRGPTADRSAAA
jgi:hypothetical protein